jgi:Ca2+-binding RTX toxin-like protein
LTYLSNGSVQVTAASGLDTLTNVETLVFSDRTVSLISDLTASNLASSGTNLTYKINNIGLGGVSPSLTGVYLSTDSTIASSDTLITIVSTTTVAVGASDNESFSLLSLALPHNLATGTYYLGVIANYNGQVAEISLTNNSSNAVAIMLANNGGETLTGTSTADILIGGAGNDLLNGGAGADAMIGGTGNDTYLVDNPGDVVMEKSGAPFTAPSGWTIKGTTDFNGDGETDVLASDGTHNQIWLLNNGVVSSTTSLMDNAVWILTGVGDFNGDGQKDLLWQNGSLQYALYLNGVTQIGSGYVSGQVADAVTPLSGSNQGIDTVLSSISYTLPIGVENLTLVGGAGSINGTGNSLNNVITGNDSANVLTGGAGIDTLTGGLGADTFVFAPNFGKDTITDFHPGEDILQFDHAIFASSVDALNHATDDGHGNTIITVSPGVGAVTIQGVALAMLHLSDFHIV